ncbi:MAG: isoleucine--tRNA ligase [Candidatus Nanopelagicales bacterium]
MYRAVPPRIDLPAMEREVLRFWNDKDVFHRSLAQTAEGPSWVFYEGPPTANGTPGTHHVEARVFKDVFPRFKTMQGFNVPRKAGWDCHGLPVELAVEKELGFGGKGDIEAYGIAEFNQKCRESVVRHVDQFEQLTERMGYWVDTDAAYWTMDTSYIQSVWWSLKRIFDAGLLSEDHRVAPYCPRCGTGLSDHELAQGYEDIVDPSVYVRFPLTGGNVADRYGDVNLLVWTTTPWTLVSNTAVAVKPTAEYLLAALADGEKVVVASELAQAVLGEGYEVLERFLGTALERASYARPFELIDVPDAHFVVRGDYVTTQDGTGLVHLAPAFGADDLAICRDYGLPVINPIRADGTFEESVPLVGGEFFKSADPALVADLEARGLMFARRDYEHAYPHCWRCHTPLLYYAQPSWYIRTTAIKQKLLDANAGTNWFPENIKLGRFGDWLENNVDWALSRNRYWGTPLPIWRCANGHTVCVESLAELGALAGRDLDGFDPHRPFVDDITIACQDCELTSYRVPEVIDGWYDSGAMPFAQWGYPHTNQDIFDQRYPADFICEAIDQTRGWFYTLMAVGVLTFNESAYKDVLCLGHILDADGRKMSKHLGNVVEPIGLMDRHGADGLRWFMLASGSPWQGRRVSDESITETVRKVLLTFWSTASFLSLYGRIAEFDPGASDIPPAATRCSMDRWAVSEANRLVVGVEDALNRYDTQVAGRLISTFIDDLSNWYVRRSRRRFWDGDIAALATLHECLRTVTLLMAPFTPFIAERVWGDLFVSTESNNPESVHLAGWPESSHSLVDSELADQMALLRRLVELGRAARANSKMKTRQPLSRALVSATGWAQLPADLVTELISEINVMAIEDLAATNQDLVEISAKANFRELGKRYGKQTPAIATLIGANDPRALVDQLEATGAAELALDGQTVTVTSADVVVTQRPRQGWAVATDSGETVALDLTLTAELRSLGLARDVVREVQEARKNQGFEVTDRIALRWEASDDATASALREYSETIAGEVLATEFVEGSLTGLEATQVADLELTFSITRA